MNALIVYLNCDSCLLPYVSKSKQYFLTQAYADDFNVTTSSLKTVLRIFRHLDEFRTVSGLKLNFGKTHGHFFNKTGIINKDHLPLPSRNWNRNMKILGIPFGTKTFVEQFWKNALKDVKTLIADYNNAYSTFDAKSIITKSLILPKISCLQKASYGLYLCF